MSNQSQYHFSVSLKVYLLCKRGKYVKYCFEIVYVLDAAASFIHSLTFIRNLTHCDFRFTPFMPGGKKGHTYLNKLK